MDNSSSSSKVTVEYHDPAGVFSLVERDVRNHLPLRNLNWQSPSRPLRQIKSLHVDLVPSFATRDTLRPALTRLNEEDEAATSFDIIRGGGPSNKPPPRTTSGKQRRHQIPGLKTTPYLRIYVLRCDDKDTYKSTERKKIREWMRDVAKSKDKHDASEWMILHVVIPDTVASSEPRWRIKEHSNESDELKERNKSGIKLPGKSTRTVFDKLRSDFNESSKNSPDRIAQIRLRKDAVPADLLPTPAIAQTLEETPQEYENAWTDLVTKLRTLILRSFDARVRQYEDDIAEKEGQRALPGWNFNTFFILKEGLARALEAVGLIEDALAIYDELSVSLETVLRGMAAERTAQTATTFSEYTDDIQERITGRASASTNGTTNGNNRVKAISSSASTLFDKDYRESIVTSTISIFDFFSYLFLRQKTLILRIANSKRLRFEAGESSKERGGDRGEDFVRLAEVAGRTLSFIHNSARALRQDLTRGLQQSDTAQHSHSDIEPLVSSWSYSVADQGLADTEPFVVDPPLSRTSTSSDTETSRTTRLPNGTLKRSDFSFGLGANPYPQRSSSLAQHTRRETKSANDLSSERALDPNISLTSPPPSRGGDVSRNSGGPVPGLAELNAQRAELVVLKRKMLEILAADRGWQTGWASIRLRKQIQQLRDVSLDDDEMSDAEHQDSMEKKPSDQLSAVMPPSLAPSLESEYGFQAFYQALSDHIISLYQSASRTKSAEMIMGDLAILKHQQGDHGASLSYFQQVLPAFATDAWSLMETEAIKLYAQCLKSLGREEDYVRTILALLGKVVEKRVDRLRAEEWRSVERVYEEEYEAEGLLRDIVMFSDTLKDEIVSPMEWYFADIEVEQQVLHHDGKDGFALRLCFRHVLDDDLEIDEISIRLTHLDDPSTEIWLSASTIDIQTGKVRLELETTTTAYGLYLVDKVTMKVGNLRFERQMQPTMTSDSGALAHEVTDASVSDELEVQRPWVFLYPVFQAFDCEVTSPRNVRLDRTRTLLVTIRSGWNELKSAKLKVKPATAGLRLHLVDADCDGIAFTHDDGSKAGILMLSSLQQHSEATIRLPYSLEQSVRQINIKLEAHYETPTGIFKYITTAKLAHELPLDVDVNDLFQHSKLISSFTIRTTTNAPLYISEAHLDDSSVYAVHAPPVFPPVTVFSGAPGNVGYAITRKSHQPGKTPSKEAALALNLRYQSLDEVTLETYCLVFREGLEAAGLEQYLRLLLPLLRERAGAAFTSEALEAAALTKSVTAPSMEVILLDGVVGTLERSSRKILKDFISGWCERHQILDLNLHQQPALHERQITISVEVPNVDVVFTVLLLFNDLEFQQHKHEQKLAVRGQSVTAKCVVQYTTQWSATSLFGTSSDVREEQRFVVDIQADPEVWLVGGKRRIHFALSPSKASQEFEVSLVPLKLGRCSLPSVEIQQAPSPANPENPGQQQQPPALRCETSYESIGQTVRVIKDLQTARVWIEESSPTDIKLPERPSTAVAAKSAA